MDYKVIYYYSTEKENHFIDDDSDELKSVEKINFNFAQNKYHCFRMFEDYETTHTDLIRFKKDFNKWVEEIKSVKIQVGRKKKYYYLNYKKYFNHNDAVYYYFSSKLCKEKLELFEPINEDEFYIFERCLNSGLICLNLDYKNKPTQCYGYDFSRYYTNLLLSLRIPTSQGRKLTLDKVDFSNLEFGIYRVKIEYTNKDFTNIFNFSSENHYTSSTLSYLNKIKETYGLTLTLLTDDEFDYNAYIYDKDDLILGKTLFNDWFKSLEKIREQFPKNRLVKHLMSSLWGTLCSFKKINIPEDDIQNYDASYIDDEEPSEYKIIKHTDYCYKVVKSSNAYNYGLARIKPFLTAFGRLKIMKFIHHCDVEKHLIRIHTDGLVFNKEINFEKYNTDYFPKPEDKTTGLIKFKNALYGFHICDKCNKEFRYTDYICHKC
jgi:hypothetical protein